MPGSLECDTPLELLIIQPLDFLDGIHTDGKSNDWRWLECGKGTNRFSSALTVICLRRTALSLHLAAVASIMGGSSSKAPAPNDLARVYGAAGGDAPIGCFLDIVDAHTTNVILVTPTSIDVIHPATGTCRHRTDTAPAADFITLNQASSLFARLFVVATRRNSPIAKPSKFESILRYCCRGPKGAHQASGDRVVRIIHADKFAGVAAARGPHPWNDSRLQHTRLQVSLWPRPVGLINSVSAESSNACLRGDFDVPA